MRDPSEGRAEFGALVRMMIQCELSQGFAGTVNNPLNVAPAASLIVSPHFAKLRRTVGATARGSGSSRNGQDQHLRQQYYHHHCKRVLKCIGQQLLRTLAWIDSRE